MLNTGADDLNITGLQRTDCKSYFIPEYSLNGHHTIIIIIIIIALFQP